MSDQINCKFDHKFDQRCCYNRRDKQRRGREREREETSKKRKSANYLEEKRRCTQNNSF